MCKLDLGSDLAYCRTSLSCCDRSFWRQQDTEVLHHTLMMRFANTAWERGARSESEAGTLGGRGKCRSEHGWKPSADLSSEGGAGTWRMD